jgi:molybdopterin-binding protein
MTNYDSSKPRKILRKRETHMPSARNQFIGTVKSVILGNVTAEVVVAVGGIEIVSVISRSLAEGLGIKQGDAMTMIIKSTEVMADK